MSAGLVDLLAAHTRLAWAEQPFVCTCEPHTSNGTTTHATHLADVITREWLPGALADERVVGIVAWGVERAERASKSATYDDAARAALTAAAEALGGAS